MEKERDGEKDRHFGARIMNVIKSGFVRKASHCIHTHNPRAKSDRAREKVGICEMVRTLLLVFLPLLL